MDNDYPTVEQATAAPGELREIVRAYEGSYEQVWLNAVPADGRTYRIIRDRWDLTDYKRPVRTVIEWVYVDG